MESNDWLTQVQILQDLEKRNALFDFRVNGWSAWRVVRSPVFALGGAMKPTAKLEQRNIKRVGVALVGTFKLISLLLVCEHKGLIVKTCRSALRVSMGDKFRDVYFDGLLNSRRSFLKLDTINSPDFDHQAQSACFPADLDSAVFTFWGLVLARLFPLGEARIFCKNLTNLLSDELSLAVSPRWLLMRISTVYWESRLYSLLLRKVKPQVVLVADPEEYGLNIACKRLGIRFIELQHGVFDALDAIPDWVGGSSTELVLPDYLACYGEYWIRKLSQTRQGELARAVGNEQIDLARTIRSNRINRSSKFLVVSSQGCDSGGLAQWIREMVNSAPTDLDWNLVIKLHPAYDVRNQYFDPLLIDQRITVVRGAESPNSLELLTDADLHLSIFSTCLFDAAALGVPSVIIPLAGHELVLDAIDKELFYLADSHDSPWQILGDAPIGNFRGNSEKFSAPGFIERFSDLLVAKN